MTHQLKLPSGIKDYQDLVREVWDEYKISEGVPREVCVLKNHLYGMVHDEVKKRKLDELPRALAFLQEIPYTLNGKKQIGREFWPAILLPTHSRYWEDRHDQVQAFILNKLMLMRGVDSYVNLAEVGGSERVLITWAYSLHGNYPLDKQNIMCLRETARNFLGGSLDLAKIIEDNEFEEFMGAVNSHTDLVCEHLVGKYHLGSLKVENKPVILDDCESNRSGR